MLVLDTSALVSLLLLPVRPGEDWAGRLATEQVHAPHLLDAEFGNALRRQVRRGIVEAAAAAVLLQWAPVFVDVRHEHGPLAADAWTLRDNLTFYDALYVALAAALAVPLVTADARLAAAPALPCTVELLTPH